MKWDGAADQGLLLTVLRTHEIKLDYAAVAKELGGGCTAGAVKERLKKLRRLARGDADNEGFHSTQSSSTPATPTKTKRKASDLNDVALESPKKTPRKAKASDTKTSEATNSEDDANSKL